MVEDLDMLAATLVHEMKNPLALVRANLDYIELCDTEKRYTQTYSAMKTQLEKTNGILKDFVGFMLSAGGEAAPVDLYAVAKAVAADYEPASRKTAELALELEPGLVVSGNHKLLAIVFSNAVKNAIEADAGRIVIRGEKIGGRVRITFTDDGCGLTAETLARLNEGGGYTTKKYGNGLGVLISRWIINSCGGRYAITSAAGGGCEVQLELPEEGCYQPSS